jgi:alpha-N-arabinofuranosidase
MALTMDLRQFADYHIVEHVVLHDEDLFATNTEEHPNRIIPSADGESEVENGILTATLKHKSWNMIRLGK